MKIITIEEVEKLTTGLGIQMQSNEIFEISKVVQGVKPSNFLIFGLGHDSDFWHNLNEGGRTIFIEDDKEWFDKITTTYPHIEAYLVDYKTKRHQWKDLIDKPEMLELEMPFFIKEIKWDIVLVDAPKSLGNEVTGRMKSIYMASRLAKNGGDVFVHDAEREVEKAYCEKYLLSSNLVSRIDGCARLDHYKLI